jgi:hypothetical protein
MSTMNNITSVNAKQTIKASRGWLPDVLMTDANGKRIDVIPPGITIWVSDPSNPPPVARALQVSLKNLDFPFSANFDKTRETAISTPTKYLKILIGQK